MIKTEMDKTLKIASSLNITSLQHHDKTGGALSVRVLKTGHNENTHENIYW
jgi:hypothetical protein